VRQYSALAEALGQIRQKLGEIDVVVSGAAGNFVAAAEKMSSNAFRTVVEIDLIGTFNVYRAAYEHLRRPGASLIAISAPQGSWAQLGQAHVCAAKAGINMLTKCLALEWGPHGVRVNAVSPGPIEGTEGVARLAPTDQMRSRIAGVVPLRRFGQTMEIAEAVLFLAGHSSGFVTGVVLDCDGGLAAGGGADVLVPVMEDRT
jgi:NAD(P)-dependent dehydrogenase (short-subunit alcohol dehydrogenase family)